MIKLLPLSLLGGLCVLLLPMNGIAQQKQWTYIIYIIGSNLESESNAGTNDILEIIDAGSTESVNVVVLTGGSDKEGWRTPNAQLYHNGEEIALDYNAAGKEMSSADNVTAFINWAIDRYPSDKVGLTFWNHGSDIRGYGNDDISGSNLSVPQIKAALANTTYIGANNKFEMLGFDACLMGNLETVSTLRDFTNWYVGSEEQEPGHGWNYTPIIQALNNADATFNGGDLGQVIVDGFVAQATSEGTTAVTLGVVNTTAIPALENSLTTLFAQLVTDDKVSQLHRARARAEEYSKSISNPETSEDMVDIGDLMANLKIVDSSLSPLADDVLVKLAEAVRYNRSDMARPKSTGLSMYIPHNGLADQSVMYTTLNDHYYPIDFSIEIRDFIYDDYVDQALADNNPPGGTHDPDFVFLKNGSSGGSSRYANSAVSAMRVEGDDVEQVQVMLIEELEGFPNEYLMLGSTHADTTVRGSDGVTTYAYLWDEHWIGINGHPAYISDIHDYELKDANGNPVTYTQIHIPVVKNLEAADEEFLIITYRFDEQFNYELESIIPEPFEDENGTLIIPKKRVTLEAGDKVQLLYEGFNEVTDEQFFVVDDEAIIMVENGNSDLMLEYDKLEVGNYQIGYHLEDHSKNDTLLFDPTIYTVLSTGLQSISNNDHFKLYPNPAQHTITIEIQELGGENFDVIIIDNSGRMVFEQLGNQGITSFDLSLPNGIYTVEVLADGQKIQDRLVIVK